MKTLVLRVKTNLFRGFRLSGSNSEAKYCKRAMNDGVREEQRRVVEEQGSCMGRVWKKQGKSWEEKNKSTERPATVTVRMAQCAFVGSSSLRKQCPFCKSHVSQTFSNHTLKTHEAGY